MALVSLKLPDVLSVPPPDVTRFIENAQTRIQAFIESGLDDPVHSFVPSDYPLVHSALRHVADAHLATGRLFCEWGSGAGVITCLAKMVGFDACGIECENKLVDLSVELAHRHHVNVHFFRGNFIPDGGQRIAEDVGEFEWLERGGPVAYDEMSLEINDFDLIFAYPWPGEERVIERIFHRFASDGALLMTYKGLEGIQLVRKRSKRR